MTDSLACRFNLQCPICASVVDIEVDTGLCRQNGHRFQRADGIWRFLPLTREVQFRDFMREYRVIRAAEGWSGSTPQYYRALPRAADDDPQSGIWKIREKNFQRLAESLGRAAPRKILDAGAGNGWLSNHLAQRGHTVAALDLSDDAEDGLGAWKNYENYFECYQAEIDRLPFREDEFDRVIFNAALHYTPNLGQTLCEAKRVLKAEGQIVVLDSPYYGDARSGARMIAEREATFARRYGFQRKAQTVGFLTRAELERAAQDAGLTLDIRPADLEWDTRLRRALAQWRTRREPAQFPLIVLRKASMWVCGYVSV